MAKLNREERVSLNIMNRMDIDIEKLAHAVASVLDLSQFKGDVVGVKIVENEFGNIEPGGIGVQNVYNKEVSHVEQPKEARPKTELCHFIKPAIVDEEEQLRIHKEIVNLVKNFKIPDICNYLNKMAADDCILLPIDSKTAMKELQRLGMPGSDMPGFGEKNFLKYYRK